MTGSLADAEDCVQESLMRAWSAIETLQDRRVLKAWLIRIATNVCLNWLKSTRGRRLPQSRGRPGDPSRALDGRVLDPVWIDPLPDPEERAIAKEDVRLALIAMIQQLPPRQRAVFILRDSLGWSAAEVASALDMSVPSVKSALHRARSLIRPIDRPPARLGKKESELLVRYARAFERADVEALVRLLREDAVLSMPPIPTWFRGREAIAAFFRSPFYLERHAPGVRLRPVRANGQPGFSMYVRPQHRSAMRAHGVQVLTLKSGRIAEICMFLGPDLVSRFGHPKTLGRR
jgi:RNA polymerase sigma-70 factor (ECF subfamily)